MISKQEQSIQSNDDRPEELPKAEECVTHLKLLTAFIYLREEISKTNDLFFKDSEFPDTKSESRPYLIEEKRWTIFVARAVKRFEHWFQIQVKRCTGDNLVTTKTCTSKGALQQLMGKTEPFLWSADNIPPLDVLMVLHSFMLNPRWFLDDCLRLQMLPLWKAGIPWDLVDKAFVEPQMTFNPSDAACNNFAKDSNLHWNNLEDQDSDLFSCLACEDSNTPSTTPNNDEWLLQDDFALLCSFPCKNVGHLRAAQFSQLSNDVKALNEIKRPLRGSILNEDGLAESQSSLRPPTLFPNRLFSLVDQKLLDDWTQDAKGGKSTATAINFFTSIKEQSMKKSSKLRTAKSNPLSSSFTPAEIYSFNRAQLAYSEGPSLFSIDLTGAVLRQGKFVQQMRDLDWIHGPGIISTMENLIDKYEVFVDIMRLSKKEEVSVPTLAVDLAWHTQQLSPEKYYIHCLRNINGVFVDHDDRIGEGDLETSFKRTTEMFKKLTDGEDYSECLCWNCAAMNERGFDGYDFKDEAKADELEQMKRKAREDVKKAQIRRFVDDYDRHRRKEGTNDWQEYMESYKWPYSDSTPSREELSLVLSQ